MLSCKQASRLISQSLDRQLSGRERFVLRFHLMICNVCSRFRKQLVLMRLAVQRMSREIEQDEHLQLSPDAKKRIADVIESTRK